MAKLSMDEIKQGIKECDDELDQSRKNLINLLNNVSIEYIDFYAIIDEVNNITTRKSKLEYLLVLELK